MQEQNVWITYLFLSEKKLGEFNFATLYKHNLQFLLLSRRTINIQSTFSEFILDYSVLVIRNIRHLIFCRYAYSLVRFLTPIKCWGKWNLHKFRIIAPRWQDVLHLRHGYAIKLKTSQRTGDYAVISKR